MDDENTKENKAPELLSEDVVEVDEYDALNETSRARSPVLWLLLLLIPIVASLFLSISRQPPPQAPEAALSDIRVEGTQAKQAGALSRSDEPLKGERYTSWSNPNIGGEAKLVQPQTPRGAKRGERLSDDIPDCDFTSWRGAQFSNVQNRLKALRRPYRLLPPGTIATKDYRPARINIDLNANNVVMRVWCG